MATRALREAQNVVSKLSKPGKCLPTSYLTNRNKLKKGIWPWEDGVRSRLPEHYKRNYMETFSRKPIPVHFIPQNRRYTINEQGIRIPFIEAPIPVVYPPQSHKGLWGGEGIVEGMKQKRDLITKEWSARIWKPLILKRIFYSEILDNWMAINVTTTTLDSIDELYGFDFYILKTHEVDLKSKLGMKLKREMLQTLLDKSMHPDNEAKREHVYKKYKDFIIPQEEIEWLGLDIQEAEAKQELLEEMQYYELPSKKETLFNLLIDRLDSGEIKVGSDSWMDKLNPLNKERSD